MADALSLVDLPAEVLCYIVGLLEHPRDVAACVGASAALACASPLDTAASYYRGRSEAALAAGLPLRVTRALFAQWEMRPKYRHLPAAAVGGRVAVLDWVCQHLNRIPPYMTKSIGRVARYTPGPDPRRPQRIVQIIHERFDPEAPIARETASGQAPSHKRRRPQRAAQIMPERFDPEAPIARKTASGKVYYAKWARSFSASSDSSTEEEDAAKPNRGAKITKYDDSRSDHSRPSEDEALGAKARPATDLDGDDAPWDYLVRAAAEAACLGHVAVLRYLTTACPLVHEPHMLLDSDIVAEAARQGALGTVTYMHDRSTRSRPSEGRTCRCPKGVGKAAAEGAQYDVLRWMHAVQCRASPCNMTNLARAIKNGDDRLVDAISNVLATGNHDPDREAQALPGGERYDHADAIMERALASAARQGHLRALAIAHVRGFAPITAALLGLAASSGRLSVLRWAAGETVSGIEAHLAPTEPLPWDAQEVVWMAARPNDPDVDVLQWLADRPETRAHFDAFMARTLIAYGCHRAVLWMHDAGLVSLASWDSLETAVSALLGTTALGEIIDRGAACSPLVMALALSDFMDDRVVALLCERYGHSHLAEAVRLHGCGLANPAIQWVHYSVPEVSVEHIIKAGEVFRTPLEQEEPTIPSPSPSSSSPPGSDIDSDEHWSNTS